MEQDAVLELLRCPRTGSRLQRSGSRLEASASAGPATYDIIDGFPVLVDFEQSILQRQEVCTVGSVVRRRAYGGLLAAAKRLVSPPKPATASNIAHLQELLQDGVPRPRILIVGGGTIGQGMTPLYEDPGLDLVAFDIYGSPSVQFVADAHRLPLPDASFDAVIIQAVLEHVLEPVQVVAEIHRVLRPEGMVYAETPFLQHVHEGPYDFTRFTESGHRYLFRQFDVIRAGASAGAGTQLLWSVDNFCRGLFRSRTAGKVAKLLFFWLPRLDRFIPAAYNVDAASGVYFLGRRRIAPDPALDMVAYYQGAQR
jgi:SAM-dependent methyltransferase